MFRKFKFEQDFYDRLRCIPLCVRLKLDLSGVKLSLKSWNRFSDGEREVFCVKGAETTEEALDYRRTLAALLEKTGEPVKYLDPAQVEGEKAEWGNRKQIPSALKAKLSVLGLDLLPRDWERFDDLQRFVLFKLSQGNHDHDNLGPALKEFLDS